MTKLSDNNYIGITNVRKTILRFLQSLFYYDKVYTWRSDPNARKIDIANEYTTRTAEIEKYPKVVVTRGDLGVRNLAIGNAGASNKFLQPDTRHIQDLASGTLIINVLSKSSIEAEQIAEKIFFAFMGYKDDIAASYYIKRITDLRIGSLQVTTQDSDFRVFQIPIYIRYDKEINFFKSFDYYDIEMYVDDERYYQSSDFWVFSNYVTFYNPPASGVDIQMSYYVLETMSGITESPLVAANGVRKVFPFSYNIYGPYYLVSGINIEIANAETPDLDTFYNFYTLYGDDIQVSQESGPRVHRQGHSYILPGTLVVALDETGYIPPFYVSNAPGQITKLAKATYSIQSGGSARCNILRNGEIIPTYSGVLVNTVTGSTDATDIYLNNGDSLALEVSQVTDSPKNLSFTIFLDYIQ